MNALLDALEGGIGAYIDDAGTARGFGVVCDLGKCVDRVWRGVSGGFDDAEMDEHWDEGNVGGVHHLRHPEELKETD